MKKMNKVLAGITAAAMFATGSSTFASASTNDVYFNNFTAPVGTSVFVQLPTWQNGIQKKDNYSSVYLYLSSGRTACVQVWGCGVKDWCDAVDNYTMAPGAYGAYYTSYRTIQIGREYLILNGVKENGWGYAGLKFKSADPYSSTTLNGRWSPDSVRESGHNYYN